MKIQFDPQEDITAYELAIIMKSMFGRESPEAEGGVIVHAPDTKCPHCGAIKGMEWIRKYKLARHFYEIKDE